MNFLTYKSVTTGSVPGSLLPYRARVNILLECVSGSDFIGLRKVLKYSRVEYPLLLHPRTYGTSLAFAASKRTSVLSASSIGSMMSSQLVSAVSTNTSSKLVKRSGPSPAHKKFCYVSLRNRSST